MRAAGDATVASRFTRQTGIGVLIGIGVLYLGREIFIPIALALLLSFFLSPPMIRLQRWGVGKTLAALLVVGVTFSSLALICWAGLGQAYNLSLDLPGYRDNISAKFRSFTPIGLSHLEETKRMLNDMSGELAKVNPPRSSGSQRTIPVEVRQPAPAPLEFLERTAGSVLRPLATSFIVVIFVVFILLGREDLRDRVLRLAGSSRLYMTTQVMDDAAQRVSRYLLMQLAVNTSYGTLIGLGLLAIGVPHPLVWAVLAALLRFIPYVGPWIAAAAPLLLAIGVAPGWGKFAWTAGLYVSLELIAANVVEPFLYGASTGISPIAILVAAVFWTWLWGPIGLLLSTPLTVCLVVVGRYVPHLEFLGILFGDEPALSPAQRFYQRMIAMEAEDAEELTEQLLKDKTLVEVYDSVIIPAMSLVEEGRHAGFLDSATEAYVLENTRELTRELGNAASSTEKTRSKRSHLICLPAKDGADELACHMLAQLLPEVDIQIISLENSSGNLTALCSSHPDLICVSGVPPQAIRHVAVRCRQLRRVCPDVPIMAAVWSGADLATVRERIPVNEANHVVCTLKQAIEYVSNVATVPSTPVEETVDSPEVGEQIAELEMLSSAEGSFQTILDGILQNLTNALSVPIGVLKLTDEGGSEWTSQCGVPPDLASGLESVEGMLQTSEDMNDRRIVIRNIADDSRFADSRLYESGIRFCARQLITRKEGRVIGSIILLDTRDREITDEETELLNAAAVATIEALDVRSVVPRSELAAT